MIFGIGLSRTGTTSLNVALTELGYRSVHFPKDVETSCRISAHLEIRPTAPLRLRLLERVDAITDIPAAAVYRALDAAYPGARFVLTVREKEPWLESCERHWAELVEPTLRLRPGSFHAQYLVALCVALYGRARFDRAAFDEAYDRHVDGVREHFAGRADLCELDVGAPGAWSKLCSFLGVQEPGVPFPAVNRAVDRRGMAAALRDLETRRLSVPVGAGG
jgi:hypothetical protein